MLRSILTVKLVLVLFSTLALAQFRTVTVQNASNNPVPTTIQNSSPIPITVQNDLPLATVVTNVPSVNVNGTVPVTGSVSIANAPTVNINGTVPVNVGNTVNAAISNTPTVNVNGPVPVNVGNTVNAAISNTPTVNINGTIPVNVGNTVTTTIASAATLSVQGAVNASITNTPTVNVNGPVGVTGDVRIDGTPNVTVSNLPTGTAGPTNTTVVLVKNLDNPAQQPFQTAVTCSTPAGLASKCTANFNVPAGKVFAIEYLQVFSSGNITNGEPHYEVLTTAGGQALTYMYAPAGLKLTGDSASDEHMVRIYADPGSAIQFTGVQTANGAGITFSLIMSGHLVNTP